MLFSPTPAGSIEFSNPRLGGRNPPLQVRGIPALNTFDTGCLVTPVTQAGISFKSNNQQFQKNLPDGDYRQPLDGPYRP